MKKILFGCFIISLVGCSSDSKRETMTKNFNSMSECLESIRVTTGRPLNIMTNEPTKVSGFQGETDLHFFCHVLETGTERDYVEGWYDREAK